MTKMSNLTHLHTIISILLIALPISIRGKATNDASENGTTVALGNATNGVFGKSPTDSLANLSTDFLGNGPADASENGTTVALGNATNGVFGKSPTDSLANLSTDFLGNGPADALENGTTVALGNATNGVFGKSPTDSLANLSTDFLGNGPADALGNLSTDALQNAKTALETGSNDALGNSLTIHAPGISRAIGAKGTTNIGALKKREQREAVTREKRVIVTVALEVVKVFGKALLTAVGTNLGNLIFDSSGKDKEEKIEPKQYAANTAVNCTIDCSKEGCDWHDCHPKPGWDNNDGCCLDNYETKCCKVAVPKKPGVEKKCFQSIPLCGENGCIGEKLYYAVEKTRKKVIISNFTTDPAGCDKPPESIVGKRYFHSWDYKLERMKTSTSECFLYLDEAGCIPCGWRLCTKVVETDFTENFVCECCEKSKFMKCHWKWTDKCHFQPDINHDPDTLKCKCNWKIRFSEKGFACCDKQRLKKCTDRESSAVSIGTLSCWPFRKTTFLCWKKTRTRLPHLATTTRACSCRKEQCDCEWGTCHKRRGRRKSACCTTHYDLVCCKGEKPDGNSVLENGTNAKTPTVFVLLMIVLKMLVNRIVDANLWEN